MVHKTPKDGKYPERLGGRSIDFVEFQSSPELLQRSTLHRITLIDTKEDFFANLFDRKVATFAKLPMYRPSTV
jgi:hypothetical protein